MLKYSHFQIFTGNRQLHILHTPMIINNYLSFFVIIYNIIFLHSNKNKRKIKNLIIEDLLNEQPFYNAPISKPKSNKLIKNHYKFYLFMIVLALLKKIEHLEVMFQCMM